MVSSIIPGIPDVAVFIVGIVVLFVIYYYLPEELKSTTKKFIAVYGIYIFMFLLWLYFRNKWGFIYEQPTRWPADMRYATFLFLLIVVIIQAGRLIMYEQRYKTYFFISDNVAGSCQRRQDVGDYTIFFIGTSGSSDENIVLPFPLPQKIVIAPKDAWAFYGSHIFCQTQVVQTPLIELPEDVREFIESDTFARWAKDKIYFGLFGEKAKTDDPTKDEIESQFKKLNARINELGLMLRGKLSHTKGFVSDASAIQRKLKGDERAWSSPQPRQDE